MTIVGNYAKIDEETQNVFRGAPPLPIGSKVLLREKCLLFLCNFLWDGEKMAKINGEDFNEVITIGEYLKKTGYTAARVAVMVNGEILPKNDYDSTEIQPDDEVEIVGFVGGG